MLALFADTDTRRRPPEWFPAHVCPTPIATDVVEMIPAVATVLNAQQLPWVDRRQTFPPRCGEGFP